MHKRRKTWGKKKNKKTKTKIGNIKTDRDKTVFTK